MSFIEKTFKAGEMIIKEGHSSNAFYIITNGKAEVVKRKDKSEVWLNRLGANDFFGEMSLLDPDVNIHNTTIRAVEDTTVVIMEKEDFEKYIGKLTPGTRNLLLTMSRRLREADQRIASLTQSDAKVSSDQAGEGKQSPQESKSPDEPRDQGT